MAVSFPFKEEKSSIFGKIYRPIAQVAFKHDQLDIWRQIDMIIDTGADYTLLPRYFARLLGVNISTDCRVIETQGVGGPGKVYLMKKEMSVRVGKYKRVIPLGFLDNDYIPPLLGRHQFLETFRIVIENHIILFDDPRKM